MITLPEYPFYDRLAQEVGQQPTQAIDWQTVANTISSMDSRHGEIIYSLILHHCFLEQSDVDPETVIQRFAQSNTKVSLQQPYGYRTLPTGKGVIFTTNRLPLALQAIIAAYVRHATQ